jgi:brefeldin A-inhibited guanine nucleotide-exchange protein
MNIISKIATAPSSSTQQRTSEAPSPANSPTAKSHIGGPMPSFNPPALSISGVMDTSILGLSEGQLKRQGLECLVAVLRSLVVWGTAAGKTTGDLYVENSSRSQISDDARHDMVTPDPSLDRLPSWASVETLRKTPDLADDPTRFESAKQKKTTLLEGIKKFNFKPKRVRAFSY